FLPGPQSLAGDASDGGWDHRSRLVLIGATPSMSAARLESKSLARPAVIGPAFWTNLGAVYNTDCLNLFAALRDEVVHCAFADPPFNLGKDYGNGTEKDDLAQAEYLNWCHTWIDESVRVLRPGGSVFIYM